MLRHARAISAVLTLDNFDPPWFWALVVAGALAVLVFTYHGIYRRSGRRLTWLLLGLRVAGVLALLAALVKPAWTSTDERTEKPRLAVVLDDSQSMAILHRSPTAGAGAPRRDPSSTDYEPRYAQAARWLRESQAGRDLRDRFDVKVFGVSGQEFGLDGLPPEPTAEQTDLVRGLRSAAGRLRGQNAAGVLLISDGRDTTGRDDFDTMEEYPLPVYGLSFRQPPPESAAGGDVPFDLAVVSVEAPQRTLVHNAVPIKVLLSKDGGPAVDVQVQIERAGRTLMTQPLALPAGAVPQQQVGLTFTPDEPGDFVLAVRVPEAPRERTATNNLRMFKLRVEAEPIRVLYVEGFLRPEYTFLHDRLGSDPDVDLVTFVRAASPERAGGAGAAAAGELLSTERLGKIDVVLLGDFEAGMLDEGTYIALREWVERGGAMMVLGGYHNLGEAGLGATPLGEALPVEPATGPLTQVEEPFRWRITDDGRRHPALSLTGDLTRDAEMWERLPELKGLVAVKGPRPAATVLARHPAALPGSTDREGLVVLASQPFGKGTVAVMTADTTWRWSRIPRLAGRPDTLYVRFWSQMVRWLARRDAASDRPALTVSTDAAAYDRGQRVTLRVRRNPAAMVPGAPDTQENAPTSLALTVRSPDGRTTRVEPGQTADPNVWTAAYFPDRGGRFHVDARLVAASEAEGRDVANQTAEFLVHDSLLEREDPSTSPGTIAEIARRTGGVYADLDDPAAALALVGQLPSEKKTITETHKASVWNHPALFLAFLGLVSAEWIVRRKNQLV